MELPKPPTTPTIERETSGGSDFACSLRKRSRELRVRRVRSEEWEDLRALRVRALEDAPDAFGSTAAEALRRSDDDWIVWARVGSSSSVSAVFVAEAGGTMVGICGVFLHEGDPGTAQIVAMWVSPDHRGRRIGEMFLTVAADWSAHHGARELVLDVTESNEPARRLYRRAGFSETGRSEPLRSNPRLLTLQMSRALRDDPGVGSMGSAACRGTSSGSVS